MDVLSETCGIQHLRLYQLNGNSNTTGSRIKVGIVGDPHPGLNSSFFFFVQRCFSLAGKFEFPGNRREVLDRYTYRTPHFHMHSHCTVQTTCVPWLMGLEGSTRIVCHKHSLIHASCFTLGFTVH